MIFSIDEKTKTTVAAMQNGDTIERYKCNISGCPNPVCSCGTVYLTFFPLGWEDEDEQTALYHVDLDVKDKKLSYYKKNKKIPEKDLQFGKSLFAQLSDADFTFLWKRYFEYKNKKTNEASLESIETLFDHREIERNGLLTAYQDILPYADQLALKINDEEWLLLDQYCLVDECACADATITVVMGRGLDADAPEQCTFSLNYKTDAWEWVEGRPGIDLKRIKAAVKKQIPGIHKKLRERHRKLRILYAYYKERHSISRREVIPPKVKIGRNEPCPCGSGKKYKKCCLRKQG